MKFKFNPFYLFYSPMKITRREKWITLITLIWVLYQGFKFVFNLLNTFIFLRMCPYWVETVLMSEEEMIEKGYANDAAYGFAVFFCLFSFLTLLVCTFLIGYSIFHSWQNHVMYSDRGLKLGYREFNKLYKASPDRWEFDLAGYLTVCFIDDNSGRIYVGFSFIPFWIIYLKAKSLKNSKYTKKANDKYFKNYSTILETTQKDIQKQLEKNRVNNSN